MTKRHSQRPASWRIASAAPERLRREGPSVAGNTRVGASLVLTLPLTLLLISAAAAVENRTYRVVVLESFRSTMPVSINWYDGLIRGFNSAPDLRIDVDVESLDVTRFDDENYAAGLLSVLRYKYRDRPPDVVIPTYTPALQFLLARGESLFPGIPVVFCGADREFVAAQELPPHVTGVTSYRDFAGTLDLALQAHPDTRRVAVIVGASAVDKSFDVDARQALAPFESKVEFTWLQGLPLDELVEAAGQLPTRTLILFLVQLEDRNGRTYIPRVITDALAANGNAPIYGLWDTLLGHGLTGGRLTTIEDDGFQAGLLATRILRGEGPAAVPIVDRLQNPAIFDGSRLERWNIQADRLPAGSRILNEGLPFWVAYPAQSAAAAGAIGIFGLLSLVLFLSRARLQNTQSELLAEHELRAQMEETAGELRRRLTRFGKAQTLGVMTTGIAHEVNQPLMAIQNYAVAAKSRLDSDVDQTAKIHELFDKIEQQAARAGSIIQHIRNFVSADVAELHPTQIEGVVEQVLRLLRPEIQSQGCWISFTPAADLPAVLADELEIQLTLINLLQNAAQSMETLEVSTDKVIGVDISQINDQEVQLSVSDRGPGVAPDITDSIFEPFFSAKKSHRGMDMGVGLAMCRAIIEAHGGKIWCIPNPAGGAIFQFTLRVARE